MKTVTIICAACGAECEKRAAEINRQRKKGRTNFYCDLTCYGNDPATTERIKENRSDYDITQHASNRRDRLSPFRTHLGRAKRRTHACTVTLEDLESIWTGTCALTGLPISLERKRGRNDMRTTASLDRIDSTLGYVPGNVQWVSGTINLAKHDMPNDQILEWISDLRG